MSKSAQKNQDAKKILFVGTTEGPSTALYYFTNLIKLGHSVYPYNPDFYASHTLREKITFKITKNPLRKRVEKVHQDLIALCRDNAFDILFVMAENFLEAQTLEEIRRNARKPILFIYHSHDNNFSPGILKPAGFEKTLLAYDYLFTTKSQNVARYENLGHTKSFFLPSAYEPTIHHPIARAESAYPSQDFEITFVGTYDNSRDTYLEAVGWHRLDVWGSRWNEFKQFQKHRERIHPKAIYYLEYSDVLTKSKIALGLLRDEAGDLHTQRTFEIPACSVLQIAPRNEEVQSFFKENREIILFEGKDELREKCDYYLKHPEKAKLIAKKGFERCLADGHSYADRLQQMFATIYARQLKLVSKKR